jgi:tRNA (cytidine/uridine-2'-O-)-methyltransferase|tara:strand:+ start:18 stop:479 length:462 start_codon:yes stop_codon:yes gene_type:complete
MRIALYQPDIPQNTGTILRLAACLGVSVDLIKPAGFIMNSKHLRRAGMDYLNHISLLQHQSWTTYTEQREQRGRIILLTTQAKINYVDFSYNCDDTLLVGSESEGVPNNVHHFVDNKICIPMLPQMRSLNVAVAISMVLGEALRQTNQLPDIQ